jgi:hypothetical protein
VSTGFGNVKGNRVVGRTIELVAGVFAAVVGVAVAAVMSALGAHAWAVVLVGLGGLGAGIAAYQRSRGQEGPWLALLWASALLLVVMTVLAIFSVGIFLLPGTLAALIAAGVATWRSLSGASSSRPTST